MPAELEPWKWLVGRRGQRRGKVVTHVTRLGALLTGVELLHLDIGELDARALSDEELARLKGAP